MSVDCIGIGCKAELLLKRIAELEAEIERERMRLAACSAAALGYFDGCIDEYKSASLDDVLRLREQLASLCQKIEDAPVIIVNVGAFYVLDRPGTYRLISKEF